MALSIVVAVSVSYTALRLAGRVATSEPAARRIWMVVGALIMGVGIWSMHFIGMLALSLPIPLAYDIPITVISQCIAIVTSGFALAVTSARKLTYVRLAQGALIMGAGISAMHYTGMAAIPLQPAIGYDPVLVAASIAIAVSASFVALWLFFSQQDNGRLRRQLSRLGAAAVMGAAISGMHYTAMAAARFAPGSFCRGGVSVDTGWLAALVGVFALGLLTVTLITTVYDSHLQSRTHAQSLRLEQVNAQLQHQATHDALTGLPNRVLFVDKLGRQIAQAGRDGRAFAVMVLDLDRFKIVNDTLGHAAGDQLLSLVARRLSQAIRNVDTLARVGGDEFLLIISDCRERAIAAHVATNVVTSLSEGLSIDAGSVHTTASVGISIYPEDGTSVDALVAHADEAMYVAKQQGRNDFQFFNAGLSAFSHQRMELENDLRRALSLQQLEVRYQPKFDAVTGAIGSVGVQLRWRHPGRGCVSPLEFIPLAEETGLICSIGEWVLKEACHQAARWREAGLPFIRVAVNVSPAQFRQADFLLRVNAVLAECDLPPHFLEFELPERTVMEHGAESIEILQHLSRMGVVVSINDFGTGYSSMSYLRRFPIDKLKIDRSFIGDLTSNAADTTIVGAIISLAHSLHLKVVAEGVETAEQLDRLRELGCDQYQGFLRSEAVSACDIEATIRSAMPPGSESSGTSREATQSRLAILR